MTRRFPHNKDHNMGRGRKRTSFKMSRKAGQAKKKQRLLKRIQATKK